LNPSKKEYLLEEIHVKPKKMKYLLLVRDNNKLVKIKRKKITQIKKRDLVNRSKMRMMTMIVIFEIK